MSLEWNQKNTVELPCYVVKPGMETAGSKDFFIGVFDIPSQASFKSAIEGGDDTEALELVLVGIGEDSLKIKGASGELLIGDDLRDAVINDHLLSASALATFMQARGAQFEAAKKSRPRKRG